MPDMPKVAAKLAKAWVQTAAAVNVLGLRREPGTFWPSPRERAKATKALVNIASRRRVAVTLSDVCGLGAERSGAGGVRQPPLHYPGRRLPRGGFGLRSSTALDQPRG